MILDVLIGCEESGVVRDAFAKLGHNAWSCDLKPSRRGGNHYQMDVREALKLRQWHIFIVHPECTFLSNSGAKHLWIDGKKKNGRYEPRWVEMEKAALFFKEMFYADVPFIGAENPIMLGYAKNIIGAEQDQIIQPWMFGHGETKATCLWLRNLPKLVPTNIVEGREQRVWKMGPSEHRKRDRSTTYEGIGEAMAQQWSSYVISQLENR